VKPAYVRGVGVWTPGYAGAAAWCRGEPDPEQTAPEAPLLAGPMRRRASPISRAAIEALGQAAREARCDLATLPSVWATAHGEHENAVAILAMMQRAEGKLSPTRFHNSVYNTASGYASIASANRSPSTTLAGGRDLAATALLEALCQLEAGAGEVALVLFDEPLLPPFDPRGALAPLALAFCLSSRPRGARAVLSNLRRDSLAAVKQNERFGDLYVSAGLPLLEHVVGGSPGTVALELEGSSRESVWCVDVELAPE
jgi:hypothetical protein